VAIVPYLDRSTGFSSPHFGKLGDSPH
jgi:hypothetical protein